MKMNDMRAYKDEVCKTDFANIKEKNERVMHPQAQMFSQLSVIFYLQIAIIDDKVEA